MVMFNLWSFIQLYGEMRLIEMSLVVRKPVFGADLLLYLRISKKPVFSYRGSNIRGSEQFLGFSEFQVHFVSSKGHTLPMLQFYLLVMFPSFGYNFMLHVFTLTLSKLRLKLQFCLIQHCCQPYISNLVPYLVTWWITFKQPRD